MLSQWLAQARKELEREIQGVAYQKYFIQFQKKFRFYQRFNSWRAVAASPENREYSHPQRDAILRPLFHEPRDRQDDRWRTVLLYLFWQDLERILRTKGHWDDKADERELWQRIYWAFSETVCKLDLAERSERIGSKIYGDTFNRCYRQCKKEWEVRKVSTSLYNDQDEVVEIPAADQSIERTDHAHDLKALVQWLEQLHTKGLISSDGLYLIVGTVLYDRELGKCAAELGLSYQAAKKCRQRTLATLSRLQKNPDFSNFFVPDRPSRCPLPDRDP